MRGNRCCFVVLHVHSCCFTHSALRLVGLGFGVFSALPWTPFVDIAPIFVIMIFDFLFIKIVFIHLFLNYFFYSSSFSVRCNIRFIWETRPPLLSYFSLC